MKLTDADNAADGIFFPALEQNMMGAVLINENDEVMFFNPAAEKLWGYKREEVIGNNIDMLIPRDLRPAHPEYIRHNREGGKARVEGMSRELQLEKKDGSKIWTRFALSKVSAEGKVYYLALVRDASVEMAQKEQTRQLIIAVDHLDRPVIVLDPERHIVQCNRAFTEMFRCSHCATGCRYTGRHLPTVQKFKMRKAGQRPFVSVMARLRGSCKLKPRQEQKPAPLSNAWQISVSIWPRWRWNRKKAASILNNSSNLIR